MFDRHIGVCGWSKFLLTFLSSRGKILSCGFYKGKIIYLAVRNTSMGHACFFHCFLGNVTKSDVHISLISMGLVHILLCEKGLVTLLLMEIFY